MNFLQSQACHKTSDEITPCSRCLAAYAAGTSAITYTTRCPAGLPPPYRRQKPSTVELGMQLAHCRRSLVMSMLWVCQHQLLTACQMRYTAVARNRGGRLSVAPSLISCMSLPANQQACFCARAWQRDGCIFFHQESCRSIRQVLHNGASCILETWACR